MSTLNAETPPTPPRTRLSVGERETRLESGSAHWILPIGTQMLGGGRPWRGDTPTALEIERAIEWVEDAVMPLSRELAAGTRLQTGDAAARQLLSQVREQRPGEAQALSLDDVEELFNELAALAQGRPLPSTSWLLRPGLAAYLVILREALHHLRFTSITVI